MAFGGTLDALAHGLVAAGCALGTLLSIASIMLQTGPFWALHNAVLPTDLHTVSVPLINALGQTGALVGAYLLGALHDGLHVHCADGATDCLAEWAGPCALVGAVGTAAVAAAGCAIAHCV